ncbi:MAG: hypothetical protein LLG16_04405, partial [Euryarchaeota archaeon]|nr:hypothetical protein [Euryarchaeota archaeon]
QAYDEEMYSQKVANILAGISGIVMGGLMVFDSPFSTAFYLAMIISLVLARKIDNLAFRLGTVTAMATLCVFMFVNDVVFLWEVVAVLLFAGFVDEVMDGVAHKVSTGPMIDWFLHYRPFSDIAVIVLAYAGVIGWIYIVPYYAFTFGYMMMERFTPDEIGSSIKGVLMRAVHLRP